MDQGWACDAKEIRLNEDCLNQDIIDKVRFILFIGSPHPYRNKSAFQLMELMQIHKSKLGDDDHWRAYTYSKCKTLVDLYRTESHFRPGIRALKNYPKRIKSYEEARNIRGVGDRTAQKVRHVCFYQLDTDLITD